MRHGSHEFAVNLSTERPSQELADLCFRKPKIRRADFRDAALRAEATDVERRDQA